MKRFQLTMFDIQSNQFTRVANQSIITGLSWEDTCKHMAGSIDANVQYANAALHATGSYSFHNQRGELCKLVAQPTAEDA